MKKPRRVIIWTRRQYIHNLGIRKNKNWSTEGNLLECLFCIHCMQNKHSERLPSVLELSWKVWPIDPRIQNKNWSTDFEQQWVQSSAIITRSNIVRYFMNNYRKSGTISVKCWIHKSHHVPRPDVFCEYLWENWPRYNGTALYLDCW